MSKLDVKTQKENENLKLAMSGIIDEDVDFNVISIGGNKEIDLDLNGVKSINSCGIREWIKWIGTANASAIRYHNCPKVIVDQINMVDGFLPNNAKVISFYVPYYNDDSGSEKNVLFKLGQEFTEKDVTLPAAVKDDEGNDMELDVIESKYFKFIKK